MLLNKDQDLLADRSKAICSSFRGPCFLYFRLKNGIS